MEFHIDNDTQTPVSHKMINLMLNNLLEEARTSKIIGAKDLSQLPAGQISKADWRKPTENQSDAALINLANGSDLILKLEPELDDFEFENVPLDVPNNPSCGKLIKSKLIIALENLKVIKKDGEYIVENQHQIANTSLAQHKQPTFNQETSVKIETSEGFNDIEKMYDKDFENWIVKSEEVHLKEEDLIQDETGILASQAEHKNTLTVQKRPQYHNETRKRNNNEGRDYQRIKKSKLNAQHLRHMNPKKITKFKCDHCQYQTIQKGHLKTHLLRHMSPEKVNMFKCDQCDFQTIWNGSLKMHLLRHINPEKVNRFKCDQCDFYTIRKGSLKRHLLRHMNPEKVNRFKCDQCDFHTIRKGNLKIHHLRHINPEKVNRFKCDQCDFQTIRKGNLKIHHLGHINPEKVNMFQCDQCNFQTIRKGSLKMHLLRHMNPEKVNRFKCDQCEYQTIHEGNLKIHHVRHINPEKVNRFKCDQCDYQTIWKGTLKRHLLRHINPEKVEMFKYDSVTFKPFGKDL